jgi:iron(III) transport system substrate-binding protein
MLARSACVKRPARAGLTSGRQAAHLRTIRKFWRGSRTLSFTVSRRGFALGASATALAACTPGGGSGAYINVYTARHYDADRTLYAAFEELTGIAVRALTGSAEQLLERLRAEGDVTEADVFVSADAGNLWRVKDAGLLQNVVTPALERDVPANLRDADGAFWGFAKRARVIIYNKAAVRPDEVATYDALATPRFHNALVMRSSSNVYQLSTLAARIERLGEANARAWAASVRANFVRDPQGADTDQIKAVGAGEAQATLCNHYYYLRMSQSEDPTDREIIANTGLVFPDQDGAGAHVNISGGGVTAHAQRHDNAVRFLEFLVSDEAQNRIAPLNSEYPIRTEITPSPDLAALGEFKEENIPLDALGRHQAEAARIFEEVGWR